jgi:hypothetical protein
MWTVRPWLRTSLVLRRFLDRSRSLPSTDPLVPKKSTDPRPRWEGSGRDVERKPYIHYDFRSSKHDIRRTIYYDMNKLHNSNYCLCMYFMFLIVQFRMVPEWTKDKIAGLTLPLSRIRKSQQIISSVWFFLY